jgi:pantoate--beta-alanine ligase
MRTLRTIAELRAALTQPRRQGATIGLVPTMGAFHEGHLSLMRRARLECDEVVVSLFVNPAQFDEQHDLNAYPRDEGRDGLLAAEENVDFLFAPAADEIYPDGFATTVSVSGITDVLEGVSRGRAHFDGVTTVVTKLLNIVAPDVAYFGQKDAQQALVIGHLVRDLNLSARIEICPTIREPDGLALSSRNARLSAEQRPRAVALHRALEVVSALVSAGETDVGAVLTVARVELDRAGIELDYLQVVRPETLEPVARIEGPALALVAGRLGDVRLIDNQLLSTNPTSSRPHAAAGSDTRSH